MEVYLKGSDVNVAPKLTEEEQGALDNYIDRALRGKDD
jgi:hypothetical protein